MIRSPAGARGLMQIMPGTAKWLEKSVGDGGCTNTYRTRNERLELDVCYNVHMAFSYLNHEADRYKLPWGSASQKAGYNWGGNRKVLKRNPYETTSFFKSRIPKETRGYLDRNSRYTFELAEHLKGLERQYLAFMLTKNHGSAPF